MLLRIGGRIKGRIRDPGLLIQSQHEKKDLETREGVNAKEKKNKRSAFGGLRVRDIQWAWGFNCSLLTWASLLG